MKTNDRKLVYWSRQKVFEAFERRHGCWILCGNEYMDWLPSTYTTLDVVASDESFKNRVDGMVRI